MKLCIDCKFFTQEDHILMSSPQYGKCGRIGSSPNLVTGTSKFTYCEVERLDPFLIALLFSHHCGKTGRYFEPKE